MFAIALLLAAAAPTPSIDLSFKDKINLCVAYQGDINALDADLASAGASSALREDTAKVCTAFSIGYVLGHRAASTKVS